MTYGDIDNVSKDAKILRDIIARQGTGILLEVMADHIGRVTNKFNLSPPQVKRAVDANCAESRELVAERT